ncbi:MAG TPA: NAD(P)/FAD-dependent oxidoreductase [Blastocatellia bacterium]|nr:NAD(P)/FAD-dependent oxidoreductase [Blastocatellia bacterium]
MDETDKRGPRDRSHRPRVVVLGGGFGGLSVARALRKAAVDVLLVDRTNHHLFQPLLYQVAMSGLSPAEIAWPIRSILRTQANAEVVLSDATAVDLAARTVTLVDDGERAVSFDYLVMATGAQTTYYGHADWERVTLDLKSLDDAVEVRRRVLLAFEEAERSTDPDERRKLLTFVVIGGGPTGVELAGALAELARFVLAADFRNINARAARVTLIEASDRVLGTFAPKLSDKALSQLKDLGVDVVLNTKVTGIDAGGVDVGDTRIDSATVIWAAGVGATPITKTLGVELDRAGRVVVEPDCSVPGHRNVFAIGDTALFLHQDGKPLPGVSPVAMQQGRFVARAIAADLAGRQRGTFHYVDKGSMATIGRSRAIAEMRQLKLSGFPAWVAWLAVHLFFLIGFKNRFFVLLDWIYAYFTYRRGARLITGRRLRAGPERGNS